MDKRVVFFIHMARTGGTTAKGLLADAYGAFSVGQEGLGENTPLWFLNGVTVTELANASQERKTALKCVMGHMRYGAYQTLRGAEVEHIVMLREPGARLRSLYSFYSSPNMQHKLMPRTRTFAEFALGSGYSDETDNEQTRIMAGLPGGVGYANAHPVNENIFNIAAHSLRKCLAVGVTEYYNYSIDYIFRALGLSQPGVIGRANASGYIQVNGDIMRQVRERNSYDARLHMIALEMFLSAHDAYKGGEVK